jgi:hypothetical protein
MLGTGFGAVVAPPVVDRLIDMFGWRTSYALCGFAVLGIALPIAFILLRGDPRDKGLLPDGLPVEETMQAVTSFVRGGDEGLSWRETWHRSEFWLLISAFFFASASVHACILHMSALLTDRGVTAQGAAVAGSVAGMALMNGTSLDRLLAGSIFCATAGDVFLLRYVVGNCHAAVWSFAKDGTGVGVPAWNGPGSGGRHHRVFANSVFRFKGVWHGVWLRIWLVPAGRSVGSLFDGSWLRYVSLVHGGAGGISCRDVDGRVADDAVGAVSVCGSENY